MNYFLFMLFGLLEGFALLTFIFTTFRMKISEYFWSALILNVSISFLSLYIRDELTISYLLPVLALILIICYCFAVVRIPLHWSILISLTGYVGYGLWQTITLFILRLFYTMDLQLFSWQGYLLQFITASIILIISKYCYSRGVGFAFEFRRVRSNKERIFAGSSITLVFLSIMAILYLNAVFAGVVILFISYLFLLYYHVRKEKNEFSSL